MEHLESAKANSDALPVVIGISIEEDDLDDLHTESPRSPKVDTFVDQFSHRGNGSQSYSRSSSTGEHETVQKKAFTKWLNSHLLKKGYPLISDLYHDLRDGTILIALLDVLCDTKIKLERGRLRVHHLNNVARALQVLGDRQVKLVNISTNDIVDGNVKLTLGLLWCIILHWQVNHIFVNSTNKRLLPASSAFPDNPTTAVAHPLSSASSPQITTELNNSVRPNSQSGFSSGSSSSPRYSSRIPISPVVPPKPEFSARSRSSNSNKGNLKPSHLNEPSTLVTQPAAAPLGTMSQNDLQKTLLFWCQEATKNYEAVDIKNFTTSWSDGFAFNALINHFRPNLFSYGEVLAMETAEMRLQHAFDLAAKHLCIEKLLDPEDLITPRPDKKSVMMYVMCLFQVLPTPATPATEEEQQFAGKHQSPSGGTKTATDHRPSDIPVSVSHSAPKPTAIPKAAAPKRPPPASSHIPVLSPDFREKSRPISSKRDPADSFAGTSKKMCTTSSLETTKDSGHVTASFSASTSTAFDAATLNEYHTDIEDILTWLLGAEEQLDGNVDADNGRFEVAAANTAASAAQLEAERHEPPNALNKLRHERIMATIEAAEYAKQRFEQHEEFMRHLADQYQKIIKTFDKGQQLIYSSDKSLRGGKTNQGAAPSSAASFGGSTSSTGSSISAGSAPTGDTSAAFDMESKRVIALQMQLLDDRFNQLRAKATNHQHYLHQMLIRTQNAQLEELRRLMTQTEERIAVLIPERFDEMPADGQSLTAQIADFEHLQETMLAEQGLLNLISKFVIIDNAEEVGGSSKEGANFLDQLEALNERWANACQITENRGKFLHKLNRAWTSFAAEEGRLFDWFNRLERRLGEMEESIDELEERSICLDSAAKSTTLRQERKFLEDIKKRLDRMQIDIFYGTEKSHKVHAGRVGEGAEMGAAEDEDEPPTTPLSKITQLTHALLGQFSSDQGTICSTVTRSIETIRNRWETLAGRIEQATKVVVKRTEQLDLAILQHPPASEEAQDEVDRSVAPKKPPRELPLLQKMTTATTTTTTTTEETVVSKTKVISVSQSAKQPATTPTTPTTPNQSTKRRKVDFCGVVDWQNMLDSMSKWIENMESSLIQLSVSGELYEGFPKGAVHQVEPPTTSCGDAATNLKMYSELVDKAGSVQKLLAKHFATSKTPSSATIQSEIDQLASMEGDLAKRNKDFEDIVQRGEKIISDYKNANEEHVVLEGVLETFKKRWSTLKFGLERSQLYSQVWCSMQSMVEESANMKHVLEKYHKRFSENVASLKQITEKEAFESLRQQVDLCSISIQGQYSKLEEFDGKLSQLYLQTPALFFCWPEQTTGGKKKFAWKRLSAEKFTTKVNIAPLQWSCFLLSIDLLSLHQIWSIMSDAGQTLIQSIDAALEGDDIDLKQETEDRNTSAESVDDKEADWKQKGNESSEEPEQSSFSSKASSAFSGKDDDDDDIDEEDDDDGSPTEKLMIAIEALNSWLKNVIDVVEEYDEDESDVEEDEEEKQEQEEDAVQPVSLGSNRSKVPGSKLKSLADLANAIDNRVYVLADLQKTVDAEQENYHFACKRAAEIIFGSAAVSNLTSLSEIEDRLKSLDEAPPPSSSPPPAEGQQQLIESIQMLISRWHLVFAKFQTLLSQLEEISPSTTLLEPEFAQINRWIEESVQFLNEAIAVGCLDTLAEQLCECERLKDYMERSVEKSFQTILSTAKEAVRILLGGKNNFEVPVIATIQETWANLGQRTLTKLDRLRLAQELTQRLISSLEEHQAWLRDFEIEILREGGREVNEEELATRYGELKEDAVEEFNWSSAIPGRLQLKRLQSKRSEYLRATLEPPDSLLSQMQAFYSGGGQSNHVFDKLKRRAKTEVVRAFDALENKLKTKIAKTEARLGSLTRLVVLVGKEQAQQAHFKRLLADVQTKQRKAMENTEDAHIALKDLEKVLTESMSVSRQSRLDEIQSFLTASSDLVQFLLDSNQEAIIEDQQNQLELILTEDTRLRAQTEAEVELVEKFCSDWKECDSRLCTLQKWFQENTIESVSSSEIFSKQEELHSIKKVYSDKFSAFRTAKSRLETHVELVQQIINEFTRDQLSQKEKLPKCDNFEEQISQMEQFLADLGLVINEMEVTLDEENFLALSQDQSYCPESELQLIPAMLQKMLDTVCVSYDDQLNEFKLQLNTLTSSTYVNSKFEKRLRELGKTHEALVGALQLRRFLLEELIELCGQINNKLIELEEECSKVFSIDKAAVQEADLAEMKQSSHKILSDVCLLKERLDIHCIRHSEILIGIEEVGARYDEIITEIAEQYVDVDGEEEEEEEEEEVLEKEGSLISGDGNSQSSSEQQVRYRQTNLASTSSAAAAAAAAAAHLSTITEEAFSTPPVDASTTTTTTTSASTTAETVAVATKTSQIIPAITVSSPAKEVPPVSTADIETVRELIRRCPYSVKPYIAQLQALERKINSISCSTGLTSVVSRGAPKLSIALVEDELHRLNKCLNEVRVPYELALCAASVSGLMMAANPSDTSKAVKADKQSSSSLPENGSLPVEPSSKWDEYSSGVVSSLTALQSEFGISWNRFLSLHRHWWLVRDATLQFNSEIRKLADWFENVELQLTNGRITTVNIDDTQPYGCFTFDADDLNYPNVARTQRLLIAQLGSHIAIYAKIQVLYNRLVACFTPDDDDEDEGANKGVGDQMMMNSSSSAWSFEDRKALLDARKRIEHEWSQVSQRWRAIIRELAWRRECLVALAAGTLVTYVSGYPYKRGVDADFDKVLADYLRYESASSSSTGSSGSKTSEPVVGTHWFQLEQLTQWQRDTEEGLATLRSTFTISDIESSLKLSSRVREYQQDLSRQLLNWMVITQEPFTDAAVVRRVSSPQHGQTLSAEKRAAIDDSFQKITLNLFEVSYFTEVFSTCFAYINSLTRTELEWVVSAHEHLNSIEDYLAVRSIDSATSSSTSTTFELPVDSLAFVASLKDHLITHENNIEQVMTIVNELRQHGKVQLSLDLRLDGFMRHFETLSALRTRLLGRLRAAGLTVWAALHHLLKQCYSRLQSYRSLLQSNRAAEEAEAAAAAAATISATQMSGSLRSHQRFQLQQQQPQQQSRHLRQQQQQHQAISSSAGNSLHRQQATFRQQSKMVADLRSYYQAALQQFNCWLALESHILAYYCALSQQSGSVQVDSSSPTVKATSAEEKDVQTTKSTSAGASTTTPVMQPARVLKFTIRRCEDFLTEFHFGQLVLLQVWSELSQLNNDQQTAKESELNNRNNDNQSTSIISEQHCSHQQRDASINQQQQQHLEPLNQHWHRTVEQEIMERIRDLQREHHKRSLAHLLNNSSSSAANSNGTGSPAVHRQQQSPPAVPPKPKSMGVNSAFNHHQQQNLYDTVADALDDGVPAPTPTYHRPFDSSNEQQQQQSRLTSSTATALTATNNGSSANLDSQRQEVETWLFSMEKRFGDFVAEYNQAVLQRRKNSLTNHKEDSSSLSAGTLDSTTEASLKKQLTIISSYQSELTQYSAKLSSLNSSVDARIAALVPNGSDIKKSNISMPYYDHLVGLRKKCDEMQIRLNDLYLSIKCKLRSLQELFHTSSSSTSNGSAASSASSRINLMSSGLVNGASLDLGIDFHGTSSSSSSKSSKPTTVNGNNGAGAGSGRSDAAGNGAPMIAMTASSGISVGSSGGSDSLPHSGSGSASSQATTVAATVSSYALHESSEKRFAKWLVEIETSLQFIEKRLEAESALNENGGVQAAKDTDDHDPLYTNVSEMQQMHMNYFEKVKIMQREIEQKRTDHRILMELLETDSESDATTLSQSRGQSNVANSNGNNNSSLARDQQNQQQKRAIDPWLARFRNRVETLNTRWNSIRLRVLTLRSRLESSSMFSSSLTTTVPATPSSASMYSINGGYGYSGGGGGSIYGVFGGGHPGNGSGGHYDETASSIAATVAFNSAASERASQLLLSLRELVEWIIKRQTEFESQQLAQQQQQQQAQLQGKMGHGNNVPLDVANVMQQKSNLLQLRAGLTEKRPIIDSSLLACHNLLRRLAIKRAQDVQQARLPLSASMASSIAGSALDGSGGNSGGHYDALRVHQIRAAKRQELVELEATISREMQRLLEVWNNLQVNVEMKLQRLDDAHLRLTDLQRAMEDLAAKLHEAEFSKAQWLAIVDIPFDQIPQQKANLKNYSQLYVGAIARDAVHVNELAARLTGRNVPLSHANLKTLEEVTTRARLLQVSVDERARDLEQAVHDHGNAQQHFLTEAVDAPWERAVTANKLPCYINRNTESVQITSPRYTEIMFSLSEFNRVRYAAYRTAMKLRSLQEKLGLDFVSMDILAEAFEQHGLGPNAPSKNNNNNNKSSSATTASKTNGSSSGGEQSGDTSATPSSNLAEDINEDLPYELRLIAVPEIISCLKMIFEMVSASAAIDLAAVNPTELGGTLSKKSKGKSSKEKKDSELPAAANINVPLCVDLCLNWVLALYDAPSRSGYIRQFSFQVALVLLSKISLEQKYLYLFNLIADENGHADERRLGLLIYDCLRLPKLLGEVAAFGGTNIEPSVRSCLKMAGRSPAEGVTAQQVLDWIRAEPQSLVWLLVLHRLRLAEKSRHPAKCNLCRAYPIVGFRYRCLKCFNFDLCQECFLCDMATKKHKSSHPMQEYCVATTSGEDMRDFTRILRNKFKSGRYFKRHQALGYLPVQSLHEGDRLEESSAALAAAQFQQAQHGSYSHNPSSNTTPVHTLPYHGGGMRAASPGALTQRDLDFVLAENGAGGPGQSLYGGGRGFQGVVDTRHSSLSSSSSLYGHRTGIVGGAHMLPPPPGISSSMRHGSLMGSGQRSATSTLGHPSSHPQQPTSNYSPFDRRLAQYHSTPVSPVHSQQQHSDDVHNRLGAYASRLAEAEAGANGLKTTPHRSLSQRARGSQPQFDSGSGHHLNQHHMMVGHAGGGGSGRSRTLPLHHEDHPHHPHHHHVNHYDLVQSPTDMLSKIAADQRSELEQIIQRLEEENKMLVTEYNQLNEEQTTEGGGSGGSQSKTAKKSKQAADSKGAANSQHNSNGNSNGNSNSSIERKGNSASDEFSPLYENVINSLERRQKEREQQKLKQPGQQQQEQKQEQKEVLANGDGGQKRATTAARDDSLDSLQETSSAHDDDDPPSSVSNSGATSGPIPAYLLEEARQLRQSKTRLESRKVELEKCNQLLESQLTHFKTYISNSGALDAKTKKRLAKSIVEMERMLDTPSSSSSPSTPMKGGGANNAAEMLMASAAAAASARGQRKSSLSNANGNGENNSNSDTSTPISSSTYTPTASLLLHSAADRVNSAVENLVEAFTEPEAEDTEEVSSSYSSGTAASTAPPTATATSGSRYNRKK